MLLQQSARHLAIVLRTGPCLYWNQECEVISGKREDAGSMCYMPCAVGERLTVCTHSSIAHIVSVWDVLLRGGRLAGGQAECVRSVQGIGQSQRCELGVCVTGLWFSWWAKHPFWGSTFLVQWFINVSDMTFPNCLFYRKHQILGHLMSAFLFPFFAYSPWCCISHFWQPHSIQSHPGCLFPGPLSCLSAFLAVLAWTGVEPGVVRQVWWGLSRLQTFPSELMAALQMLMLGRWCSYTGEHRGASGRSALTAAAAAFLLSLSVLCRTTLQQFASSLTELLACLVYHWPMHILLGSSPSCVSGRSTKGFQYWPWTQKPQSAGVKGVQHHAWLWLTLSSLILL